MIKIQSSFRAGDQHVSRYGDPYLSLEGVLSGAEEHLNTLVLLGPFEERFHLPALTVQVGDKFGLQCKIVGQKDYAYACIVLDHHAAHRRGVTLARIVGREHARLVAHRRRVDPIHRVRVAPLEFCVALGASHEEGTGLVNHKQPIEIQIARSIM